MNKEEIIKALKELQDESFDMGMKAEGASHEEAYYDGCFDAYDSALEIIQDELGEVEKVVIPQFVADYIDKSREEAYSLYGAFDKMPKEVANWLIDSKSEGKSEGQDTFARAWLDGYEVEKEKLYIVQLPTNLEDDLIILDADGDIWKDSWPSRYKMTEKRIKEIDERYWPFAKEVAE